MKKFTKRFLELIGDGVLSIINIADSHGRKKRYHGKRTVSKRYGRHSHVEKI